MTSLLPGSLLCLAVFMIDAGDLDRVSVLALLLTKHMSMSNSILTCHMSSAGDEIITKSTAAQIPENKSVFALSPLELFTLLLVIQLNFGPFILRDVCKN